MDKSGDFQHLVGFKKVWPRLLTKAKIYTIHGEVNMEGVSG